VETPEEGMAVAVEVAQVHPVVVGEEQLVVVELPHHLLFLLATQGPQ